MKELPILMTGENVRAILSDRKTQTRRCQGLEVVNKDPDRFTYRHWEGSHYLTAIGSTGECHPRYQVGDVLWVRETHGLCVFPGNETSFGHTKVLYRADGETNFDIGKWRPSIFMPRWASRISLEVTEVRCERVQDISSHDAEQEGCNIARPISAFHELWDSINGKPKVTKKWGTLDLSFAANPWVFAYTFKRVKP